MIPSTSKFKKKLTFMAQIVAVEGSTEKTNDRTHRRFLFFCPINMLL